MSYTQDYSYCAFSFPEWNKIQEKCLPYFTMPRNLVLAASVASGKTAVAEAIMGWELSKSSDSICLYVSPLKALSAEKFEIWSTHPTFKNYSMELLDSDHHPEDFSKTRIVLSTIESVDLACRFHSSWLERVSVLILDEAHILGSPDRGHTAEAVLMEFSQTNPNSRLILLSGTMSNAKEIGMWVNNLNSLETSFISSSWRPTTLYKLVESRKNLNSQISFIVDKVISNPDEKILIFVHSKKTGEILKDKIRKAGKRCAFFSADLKEENRLEMIERFKNPLSGLDVMVATSSLAMGVSL